MKMDAQNKNQPTIRNVAKVLMNPMTLSSSPCPWSERSERAFPILS